MAKNILSKYKDRPYANLMTDLIFKKVFNPDDAFTKVNLMNLLNDVLAAQLESPIVDVFPLDKEQNASGSRASRTSIFDLHCRDRQRRTFIVEVQIKQMEHFLKRSFYYASQAIVRQGLPGKLYDYNFEPVFVLAICWPNLFDDAFYVHNLSLCDTKTKKCLRNFANFTFLELQKFPGFGSKHEALRNWMYLFRYLHTLKILPPQMQKAKFTRLLEMAKVARLERNELQVYEKEIMSLEWDEYAVRKTRRRINRELREKALAEGLTRKAREMAKSLLESGVALPIIAKASGLSAEEIQNLK